MVAPDLILGLAIVCSLRDRLLQGKPDILGVGLTATFVIDVPPHSGTTALPLALTLLQQALTTLRDQLSHRLPLISLLLKVIPLLFLDVTLLYCS